MKTRKEHSTNYTNTFIEVAEDCTVDCGTIPPTRHIPTIAALQYALVSSNPYRYTSDDLLFRVFAERKGLEKAQYHEARTDFFSKGQPCLRASPLTKSLGFGIHCDSTGKVALYGVETTEYAKFLADNKIKKIKAMRSKRDIK